MTAPCLYCGDTFRIEVLEAWLDERAFMLDTCCEGSHELAIEELNEAPRKQIAAWLAGEIGCPVRQLADDGERLLLDYGLTLGEVKQKAAKEFVRRHHAHAPKPPAGWRWGHGIYNGSQLVAIAMVGRPVARMIDASTTVEVNRLCVARDIAPGLVWNACSMLYGAAAREAKRRGFATIITYTMESEPADTLKAAGWTKDAETRGGSWNRPSRARRDTAPTSRKVRWKRELRKGGAR